MWEIKAKGVVCSGEGIGSRCHIMLAEVAILEPRISILSPVSTSELDRMVGLFFFNKLTFN